MGGEQAAHAAVADFIGAGQVEPSQVGAVVCAAQSDQPTVGQPATAVHLGRGRAWKGVEGRGRQPCTSGVEGATGCSSCKESARTPARAVVGSRRVPGTGGRTPTGPGFRRGVRRPPRWRRR